MAALAHLTTADDATCDADDRVLTLALARRNNNRRGRREPLALFFPATGTAVEIDPTTGRIASGGPVGPKPAPASQDDGSKGVT